MKKIKCIDLFLEKTSDLTSIHPEMHEISVSQPFQKSIRVFLPGAEKFLFLKYRKFLQSGFCFNF